MTLKNYQLLINKLSRANHSNGEYEKLKQQIEQLAENDERLNCLLFINWDGEYYKWYCGSLNNNQFNYCKRIYKQYAKVEI